MEKLGWQSIEWDHICILAANIHGNKRSSMAYDASVRAATIYFFARAVHFVMHIIAVPLMRTLMFLVGFACQMAMAINLLSII